MKGLLVCCSLLAMVAAATATATVTYAYRPAPFDTNGAASIEEADDRPLTFEETSIVYELMTAQLDVQRDERDAAAAAAVSTLQVQDSTSSEQRQSLGHVRARMSKRTRAFLAAQLLSEIGSMAEEYHIKKQSNSKASFDDAARFAVRMHSEALAEAEVEAGAGGAEEGVAKRDPTPKEIMDRIFPNRIDLPGLVKKGLHWAWDKVKSAASWLWKRFACPACTRIVGKLLGMVNSATEKACASISTAACDGVAGGLCGPCAPLVCPFVSPIIAKGCNKIMDWLTDKLKDAVGADPDKICEKLTICDEDEGKAPVKPIDLRTAKGPEAEEARKLLAAMEKVKKMTAQMQGINSIVKFGVAQAKVNEALAIAEKEAKANGTWKDPKKQGKKKKSGSRSSSRRRVRSSRASSAARGRRRSSRGSGGSGGSGGASGGASGGSGG